jgi:cation:H+ antiporter
MVPAPVIDGFFLLGSLVIILASAELFTNGVEWLGQRLQLSEGVVGSVLAAVGTALPETLIPVVSVIFFASGDSHAVHAAHEVGIGAIAGAPFMLSTLTLGLCGGAILLFAKQGKRQPQLTVNEVVLKRDLSFFIVGYAMALICASPLSDSLHYVRWIVAALLVAMYFLYLRKTFTHEGEVGEAPEHLHLNRVLKLGTGSVMIMAQVVIGLVGIVGGAILFVEHVRALSNFLGVPPVILSLIIAPVATELPEKVNSILWARKSKDTLALGNITGALVFQSCWPAAFGIVFTEWDLGMGTVISGIVAICSAFFFLGLLQRGKLSAKFMMLGILGYVAVVSWLLITHPSN